MGHEGIKTAVVGAVLIAAVIIAAVMLIWYLGQQKSQEGPPPSPLQRQSSCWGMWPIGHSRPGADAAQSQRGPRVIVGNALKDSVAMSAPSTNSLVRCEGETSSDGRTGAHAEATGQQFLLPFTTWRPAVGDNTSTPELGEHPPAASTKELQSPAVAATLPDATVIRRKRGPSLSRRTKQAGNVFQHSEKWDPAGKTYGRFWIDVPGSTRQRRTIRLVFAVAGALRNRNSRTISKPRGSIASKHSHQPRRRRRRFGLNPRFGLLHFQRGVASRSNPPPSLGGDTRWINGCCQILATNSSGTWAMPRSRS